MGKLQDALDKLDERGGFGSAQPRREDEREKPRAPWRTGSAEVTPGDKCEAQYTLDDRWYVATVLEYDSEARECLVLYDEYGNQVGSL